MQVVCACHCCGKVGRNTCNAECQDQARWADAASIDKQRHQFKSPVVWRTLVGASLLGVLVCVRFGVHVLVSFSFVLRRVRCCFCVCSGAWLWRGSGVALVSDPDRGSGVALRGSGLV